jgi:gliding motility-associated-like protein
MSYYIIEFKNHKMARFVQRIFFLLTVFSLFAATIVKGQITSSSYDYVTSPEKDSIFIFCTSMDRPVGELTAKNPMGVSATFSWEKYDTISGTFIPFNDVSFEDTLSSTISMLEDGLYRVNINSGGNILLPYQAYVLNDWIEITKAEIPDSTSTCDGFQILGDFESAPLRYFDPNTNSITSLNNKPFKFQWSQGVEPVSTSLNFYVSPPVASETPIIYKLTVTDQIGYPFGCSSPINQGSVEYYSKVPKSIFGAEPLTGEAVLKVTFSNTSINSDSDIWFFYKNDDIIKKEVEDNPGEVVDSIDFVLLENAPVYEYEWAGKYKVKLVTVHINNTGNCYDTLYMKPGDFINVDTALVEAPNVFTPNGDGLNDMFVVKTQSLKSMTIHIYNRWGGLVHSWSYSNIRSRDYTYEYSVWDGKIGGRMASPGVYFYVITVVRRDDKPAKPIKGFFHLFRDKD